jgi:CO dehydrogenase nickel-insertion accessory protein CooC1
VPALLEVSEPTWVAILGNKGVGKNTILGLLEEVEDDRLIRMLTTVELKSDDKRVVVVFFKAATLAFTGDTLQRCKLIIIVTDSTAKDVDKIASRIPSLQKSYPEAMIMIIANKQDKYNVVSPEKIKDRLGVPVHGMSATVLSSRDNLVRFILRYLD